MARCIYALAKMNLSILPKMENVVGVVCLGMNIINVSI